MIRLERGLFRVLLVLGVVILLGSSENFLGILGCLLLKSVFSSYFGFVGNGFIFLRLWR